MKKVSILLATYNGEKYLAEQLDSILNQTYSNLKIYISDDVSSDRTIEILSKYASKYPNKINVINTKKRNGSATLNFSYLFENVQDDSDYYMFCDQDDVWLPNKVELLVDKIEEMEKKGLKNNLVYCDAFVVNENLDEISSSFYKYAKLHYSGEKNKLLITNDVPGAAMLFDKNLKMVSGKIPKECYVHDFWLMLYATFYGNVEFVDEALYKYRQHSDNVAGSGIDMSIIGIIDYLKKHNILKIYKDVANLYRKQANLQKNTIVSFYERNKNNLKDSDKEMMNAYFSLFKNKSKARKIYYIFKYKLFHNTVFRTLIFIITMR